MSAYADFLARKAIIDPPTGIDTPSIWLRQHDRYTPRAA